jgi:hypothetical protein
VRCDGGVGVIVRIDGGGSAVLTEGIERTDGGLGIERTEGGIAAALGGDGLAIAPDGGLAIARDEGGGPGGAMRDEGGGPGGEPAGPAWGDGCVRTDGGIMRPDDGGAWND